MTSFHVVEVQVVELEWVSIPMDRDYKTFKERTTNEFSDWHSKLIYAFEGRHDAYPTGAILYIGKMEGRDKRPDQSAKDRIYGYEPKMSPCYRDMILRLAIIPDEPFKFPIPGTQTPAGVLERLLFHAMKPGLNSRQVDQYLPEE